MPPFAAAIGMFVASEVAEVVIAKAMTNDSDSSDIQDDRTTAQKELDNIMQ